MKRSILLCVFVIIICMTSCKRKSCDVNALTKWIQIYREEKSFSLVTTSGYTKEFREKYLHKDFTTVGGKNPKFIIIANSFSISSVKLYDNDYIIKKYGKTCYVISGAESYLGEISNGKIIYYDNNNREHPTDYVVIFTNSGFFCMYDWMYDNYYILEKDVPIFMKRLKESRKLY